MSKSIEYQLGPGLLVRITGGRDWIAEAAKRRGITPEEFGREAIEKSFVKPPVTGEGVEVE